MLKNIIVKATSDCNIGCSYCYVERSRDWSTTQRRMSPQILEALISKIGNYCDANSDLNRFVFYWHGGEPLLAGPEFYQEAVRLQRRYMPAHTVVANTIQTNGVGLNEKWIDLLTRLNFDICVSLDGPPDINDIRRKTKSGAGTYRYVRKALQLLQERESPVSILAVITPEALPFGRNIYQHFRDLGCQWMDFMYPMCNRMNNTMDGTLQPVQWGRFYIDVFDAWAEEGDARVYIRQLHDWCMLLLGGKTDMCTSQADCSYVMTVNTDGNVFVCDDLMPYCDGELGNIVSHPLANLVRSEKLQRLSLTENLYGDDCLGCDYFTVCAGGCSLFRVKSRDDFSDRHFFCESQRLVADHIKSFFERQGIIAPHADNSFPLSREPARALQGV